MLIFVVVFCSSFSASAAGAEGKKPVGVTTVHGPGTTSVVLCVVLTICLFVGYTGPACVRQITPFPFANPPRWTQPTAYRPSKHKHLPPYSCQDTANYKPPQSNNSGSASSRVLSFRFDPTIEGISLPPQRGVMPEGLVHSWHTCLFFIVQETSFFGKMAALFAVLLFAAVVFALASPRVCLRKLRRCVSCVWPNSKQKLRDRDRDIDVDEQTRTHTQTRTHAHAHEMQPMLSDSVDGDANREDFRAL